MKRPVQSHGRNQHGNTAMNQAFLAQHCINYMKGFRVIPKITQVLTYQRDKNFDTREAVYKAFNAFSCP
jgi:hypothetical protein